MPTSPYAASKYMGELVMLTNDNLYRLPTLQLEIAERSEGDFFFDFHFGFIHPEKSLWTICYMFRALLSATKELALLYGLWPSQPRHGRLCHHHRKVYPSAEER